MNHPITRYDLALCIVAIAAAPRAVLGTQFRGLVPFATFFPAVLVAILLTGLGPGIAAFEEALQGRRESFELVYRMRGADGAWRWVRNRSSRVRTSGIDWVVGILADITAERAAEERQRLVAHELDHRLGTRSR